MPCHAPHPAFSLRSMPTSPRRRREVIWIAVSSDLNINSHNHPRGAILRPSDASNVAPSKTEGAGNAGRWPHPQALWAEKERCPQVSTGRPKRSGTPCAMALRLTPRSPRGTGLSSPRRLPLGRLDPSIGGSGPHGLTVRDAPHALRHHRVHRIPRHVSWRSRNALRSERGTACFNHDFCVSERLIF